MGLVDHWEREAASSVPRTPDRSADAFDREGLLARFVAELELMPVVATQSSAAMGL